MNNFSEFLREVRALIPPERLVDDPLRTLAYGTDASFYRLTPKLVVTVRDQAEVVSLVALANRTGTALTFRAAGTSLSGQAVTDSVLVRLGEFWSAKTVVSGGAKIRLQPGVIGADANRLLKPLGRKIGPDPASINSAQIGGIAANNASGMCCGTADNSYQTLDSVRLVFADGTVLDTADSKSRDAFSVRRADLISGVIGLCQTVRRDAALQALIRRRYRIKNTTGYGLNALLDYIDPIDVIAHLMIGSEGTLGFISEITYRTVVEHEHKASALLFFDGMETTAKAVTALSKTAVAAVELMDGLALHAIENQPGVPDFFSALPKSAAALLIEVRDDSEAGLVRRIAEVETQLRGFSTLRPFEFSSDPAQCAEYWKIRKGLFPTVGAMRDPGTTVVIEDVAFPIDRLASAVLDLQGLFEKHGYTQGLIFGHALEGNLHFVFPQNFSDPREVKRYADFMDDVTELVVHRYDGSLKAEHGTGRNMAPFVELEWGSDAYQLMWRIKNLFDPNGILNPDVVLTDNPALHLQNLKPMVQANALIDQCIECGFCEKVCASKRLTLTPRQRIVVTRELARLRREGGHDERIRLLEKESVYQVIDSCAADGLCAIECPVGINTGDLVRQLRSQRNEGYGAIARWLAQHFGGITALTRMALALNARLQRVIGRRGYARLMRAARRLSGNRLPHVGPAMPSAAKGVVEALIWVPSETDHPPSAGAIANVDQGEHDKKDVAENARLANPGDAPYVVYFPSCASRTMGPSTSESDSRSLVQVTESLLRKAGYRIIYPNDLGNLCCGMPFESKGHFDAADVKTEELNQALLSASEGGRYPVLMDTSPCEFRSGTRLDRRLEVFDPIAFAAQKLLPRLAIEPSPDSVMLHITCSTRKQGLADQLQQLASALCRNVIVPEDVHCCGFAGDKGFNLPQLNQSALAPLRAQLPEDCTQGISTSRTCEIGLSEHSGISYHSIFYLMDRVSTSADRSEEASPYAV